MLKKIYKALLKGTNLFFILLMIDYITTLFSLNETSKVVSKLGIIFNHVETSNEISTSFGVDIKMLVTYCAVIGIALIIELLSKRNVKPAN